MLYRGGTCKESCEVINQIKEMGSSGILDALVLVKCSKIEIMIGNIIGDEKMVEMSSPYARLTDVACMCEMHFGKKCNVELCDDYDDVSQSAAHDKTHSAYQPAADDGPDVASQPTLAIALVTVMATLLAPTIATPVATILAIALVTLITIVLATILATPLGATLIIVLITVIVTVLVVTLAIALVNVMATVLATILTTHLETTLAIALAITLAIAMVIVMATILATILATPQAATLTIVLIIVMVTVLLILLARHLETTAHNPADTPADNPADDKICWIVHNLGDPRVLAVVNHFIYLLEKLPVKHGKRYFVIAKEDEANFNGQYQFDTRRSFEHDWYRNADRMLEQPHFSSLAHINFE